MKINALEEDLALPFSKNQYLKEIQLNDLPITEPQIAFALNLTQPASSSAS